jgi:predicted XRE-type DNA-binding protein
MAKRKAKNVFDDLGFSRGQAKALAMKTELHSKVVRYAKHYSQAELQSLFGESQPRVSDLMRGKLAKFSLEALIGYADALDLRPEIRLRNPLTTVSSARAR